MLGNRNRNARAERKSKSKKKNSPGHLCLSPRLFTDCRQVSADLPLSTCELSTPNNINNIISNSTPAPTTTTMEKMKSYRRTLHVCVRVCVCERLYGVDSEIRCISSAERGRVSVALLVLEHFYVFFFKSILLLHIIRECVEFFSGAHVVR